ncbi:MAG: amino acid adenylation domain-containing protein, partial [Bacillota bacterium]
VLKAGGAYLPIDPSYPYDRIRFMLEDSQAEILLMDKGYVCIEDIDIKKIYLYNNESYHEDKTGLVDINKPSDLAYIIYTSGTTGKPKGVMVEHGSMSDRIRWRRDEYKLGHTDSVLQTFSFAFDGFVTGLFTPIISGSKIILMRDEEASDPVAIKYLISVHKITHFIAVPTLYSAIMDCITIDEAKSLRIVTLAGERIPPKIVEETVRKNKSLELVNEYGPTECTVVATICRDLQDKSRITIGKPIENTMIYILNSERKVLPVGVPGEIYISGIGVARGYLNKPELTKDKFMSNPFVKGERMYKTGDLGRWLSDGSIEFLGRSDHQVKVRGFRIELEEIENCLLAHKEIRQAVVLAREDESGNNYLCAYIVSLRELLIADLRKHLSDEMPDYMIPTYFVRMDKFPVTHNGKVDRILLPEPGGDIDTGVEYEAPRNEIEKKMAGIWQEILSLKNEPGINHDFFELGGHSLKATILVSRIHKEFQAEMPLSILFKKSTIKDVSEYVQNANKSIFSSINPVDKRDYYPLSSAQKRMFLLNHMGEKNTVYNTPSVTIIEGNLDRERVESVFRKLIVRHEPFRTRFKLVDDNPVQEIFEEVDFKLEYSEVEESELESKIKQFIRPFDLSMAPILRVDLIRLDYNKHAMLVDMHHIISDGVSAAVILTQEFSKLYNGEGLPQLRIQYKDYAVWQNEVFESEVLKRQERYWLERFSGEIPVLNLPTDYLRPSSRSFEGTTFYFSIDKNMSKRLKALAEQNGVTLYMVMLAAYNVLLYRYTGQEDIVVGTPVANRTHDDLQNVLGMFVNTLAMRNFPDGKKTFIQFMHEVRENALKAYQNQDYQFEQLVEKLNIKRDISRSPLFDTIFVLQNVDFKELNAGALKVSPYRFKGNTSKFDISLSAVDTDEKIEFGIEYCTKLFKQETIERLSQHFTNILKSICQNPLTEINNLDMSSNEEKQKLIYEFNRTESEYSFNKTIHELFEEAVEKKPDNIAVMFDGSTLTYKELNNKSNQLARFLKEKGVGAESIVGIMADRSLEMVVGIMGILKAGGAYLPISPDYPDERASYMLNDSGSKILLSQKHLLKRNVSFDTHVVELEDEDIYRRDCSNFIEKGYPSDVAYVIYTSGSTGKPKGVMIEHSSVVNILTALQKRYPLMESDVYLFKTAFTFDVSVAEIFGWFHENGRLAILSKGMEKDTEGIVEAIEKYKVTHMNFVPSMLNAFISMLPYKDVSKLQSLKYIFAAGEAIPKELVNKFYSLLREVELVNIYGPTEATIYATYYPLRNLSCETNVPIGRPLDNVRVYVLGKSNCLQPIGIPGELCIAGAGLARGYLNRPKLSEEKFVNNTCLPKERLYRTGDLVRWLPDGNIEFLGRIDHQVKIRGYRVELGEIESHLLEYENIKEAVVTLRENKGGDRFLCAYYVSPEELSINKLRTYLLKKLPDYMMPAYFMKIEEIPLTASGKIDRKALPEPGGYIKTGVEYEAPRNKLEESLVEVWKEVLGINKVGIDDNFFSLGGDSIKVIQIQSRLHKYKLSFETKDIFQNPTIRELAEYVKLMSDSAGQGIVEGEAALTPIQIWFFERNFTNMHHWNQAVMLYKEDGFREEVLKVVLDQIVQHHDALRMIYISSDEGVRQVNRGLKGSLFGMAVYDLTCEKEYERIILERADILHKSFDISKGPLIKAAMFKTIRGDYLLISVHHLVIDGVSWRIIFEDIEIAYRQMEEEKEVQLPMKTVSYKDWSQKLCEYAGSIFKRELKYWKEVELTLCPSIPRDREINGNRIKDSRNISIQLPEEDTSKLLKEVNRAYNTEINDILLAALGGAVKNWAGINRVLVNIEGHGREDIIEGIDITRTVGWFTSLYPVILDIENADDISYLLRTTKEMLRRIPNKGVGYGIIKYLGAKKSGEEIEFKLAPDICFNYLGQFEQNTNRPIFKIADLNVGSPISPESEKAYALDIVSMVVEGRLRISVSYSTKEYNESTIMDFIEEYRIIIQKIIEHCIDKEGTEMTLSDYSDSELQEQDLEDFFNSLK